MRAHKFVRMVTSLLLLLAIALVLIGVVTLVIGIISNTLAWVFISIGATVAAGIVLYVLYRLGRKQAAAATGAGAVTEPAPAPPTPSVVPAPTSVPPAAQPSPSDDRFAPALAAKGSPDEPTQDLRSPIATATVDAGEDGFEDEEDFFPIAEYEDLRVAEILPLLPELDADELDVVREREASTKARATILNRIDELAPNALGAWSDGDREGVEVEAEVGEPGLAPEPVGAGRRSTSPLPIAGYDDLKVAEILPILTRLGASDLEAVAAHERRGPNRQTILNRIEGRVRYLESNDVVAAVPARRGRPPKDAASAATPARRGRPPKDASSAGLAAAPARRGRPSKDAATAAAPARRGRPPKDAATTAVPARRGRPSKDAPSPATPARRGRPRKDAARAAAAVIKAPTATRAASATKATKAAKSAKTAKAAKSTKASTRATPTSRRG